MKTSAETAGIRATWPPETGQVIAFESADGLKSGVLKDVRWGLVWRDFILEDGRVIAEHRVVGCPQPPEWRSADEISQAEREAWEERLVFMIRDYANDKMFLVKGSKKVLLIDSGMSLAAIILVTVVASEIGDLVWYELGRSRGASVLRILCKISLEPDSCVRKSENAFARHTTTALIYSKFLPGVGHLGAPVAGLSGMSRRRFLVVNAIGSLLWAACERHMNLRISSPR